MVPCPSWRSAALMVLVLAALLLASPAGAHPFVRGGEIAVDSLATIELDLVHGCGSEQAGTGEPTREVALEVPDWLRVVEVPPREGWELHVSRDGDGRVGVVTWFAVEAEEPAPVLELSVVAAGEPGETRYLGVFQGCETREERWIGTPDAPAGQPAVRVTLAEPDPDAPPPPEELPEVEELEPPAADAADDPVEDPVDDPADDPVDDPVDEPADDPVDDPADDPVDEPVDAESAVEAAANGADRGLPVHPGLALMLGGVLVLVLAAGWWWRGRSAQERG